MIIWNEKCLRCLWSVHAAVLSLRNVHIFCCLCNPALLWKLCMYSVSEEMFHRILKFHHSNFQCYSFIFWFCKSKLISYPFLDFTNLSQGFLIQHRWLVYSHRSFQSVLSFVLSLTASFVVDRVEARCLCVQLVVIVTFQFPASRPPLIFRQWLWYNDVIPSSSDFLAFRFSSSGGYDYVVRRE